jgi:hypothetical protein
LKNPEKCIRKYRSGIPTLENLIKGIGIAHPALFFKREIYDYFGLFNENFKIAGDFEFILRVFNNSYTSFKYLPEVMVRMQLGGLSNKNILSTSLKINKEILMACRINGVKTNYFKILKRYPKKIIEYILIF